MIYKCSNCGNFIEANYGHHKCSGCGERNYWTGSFKQEEYIEWLKNQGKKGEKKLLSIAVDEFAKEMKNRLHQKIEEGYEGWEDIDLADDIYYDLAFDCLDLKEGIFQGLFEKEDRKKLVDIANRSMILARFCK